MVLEAEKSKIKAPADLVSGLWTSAFLLYLRMADEEERERDLVSSL